MPDRQTFGTFRFRGEEHEHAVFQFARATLELADPEFGAG